MFNDADRHFMVSNMKIIVESIESKLDEYFFEDFKEVAIFAISKYIDAIKNFEASGVARDLLSGQDNEAEELIKSHHNYIVDEVEDEEVIQVFDALRHSFSCYAYNGLHQLYTRQENECWHPKIKITEILTPNDIENLDQVLTLYRGCDVSEFESGNFGQAWSTSLESAKEFAYLHYKDQDWFDIDRRVVLETTYSRDHVLFSDQSIEFEVVVDAERLVEVRKYA